MTQGQEGDPDRGTSVTDEAVDPRADLERTTRHLGAEIVLSGLFALIGVGLVALSGSIRAGSIPDPITSAGMPRLTGYLLIFFSGVMLVRYAAASVRRPRTWRVPSQGDNDEPGHPSSLVRPLAVVVAGLAWTWAVDLVGYFLAMPLLVVAVLRIMDVRSRAKLVAVPIGFTVVIWLLFAEMLGIKFPLGFMDTPLREIGFIR